MSEPKPLPMTDAEIQKLRAREQKYLREEAYGVFAACDFHNELEWTLPRLLATIDALRERCRELEAERDRLRERLAAQEGETQRTADLGMMVQQERDELLEQRDRLREEYIDACADAAKKYARLRALLEKARDYLEHDPACATRLADSPCACGYDALLAELEQEKQNAE